MTYNSGSICWAGRSILQSHFTYGTSKRVAMFEAIEWTGLLEPVESNIRILALERCTLCVVVSMITRETWKCKITSLYQLVFMMIENIIIKNKIYSRYTYDRGHIVVLLFIIHINIVCCRCTFDRYARALCFITRCNTSPK